MSLGSRAQESEGRGAALQEIESMPCSRGREGERSRCVQMFRWRGSRGKIITDRFLYPVYGWLFDIVLRLIDVAPVYEHLGSKSVSTTTKSPLDSAM